MNPRENNNTIACRMSFVFPSVFKLMLLDLKNKYKKDMTYIIMEAVNEWVMKKENLIQDGSGELNIVEKKD